MNKTEIDVSTAREQQGLGSTDAVHDGYHAAYKVMVCHVVRHSRPAPVALTFSDMIFTSICNFFCLALYCEAL